MWSERRTAGEIVAAEGLSQVSDTGALEAACRQVVEAQPGEVARFKGGRGEADGLLRRRR